MADPDRSDVRRPRPDLPVRLGHVVAQDRRAGHPGVRARADRRGAAHPRPPRRQPRRRRAAASCPGPSRCSRPSPARAVSAATRDPFVPGTPYTLSAPGRPTITVTATPCRHGPPGSRPIVGEVIGFALSWEGQEHGAVWISGDTVLYDGVRRVADRISSRDRDPPSGPSPVPDHRAPHLHDERRRRSRALRPHEAAHRRSPCTTRAGPTSTKVDRGITQALTRRPLPGPGQVLWATIGEPSDLEV